MDIVYNVFLQKPSGLPQEISTETSEAGCVAIPRRGRQQHLCRAWSRPPVAGAGGADSGTSSFSGRKRWRYVKHGSSSCYVRPPDGNLPILRHGWNLSNKSHFNPLLFILNWTMFRWDEKTGHLLVIWRWQPSSIFQPNFQPSTEPRRTPEIWPWLRSSRVDPRPQCCWLRWSSWRRWTPRGWWRCSTCDLRTNLKGCHCWPWGNWGNWGNSKNSRSNKPLQRVWKKMGLRKGQCWSELAVCDAVSVERFADRQL